MHPAPGFRFIKLLSSLTPFINMAKFLIRPWSKSTTASKSFYTSRILFSQKISEEIDKAVEEGILWNVVCLVKGVMQNMSTYQVRVAVTGDSGNGMSSFINALRRIGHEEENSAPTGVVRITHKPACYSSPDFPNVDLWDLPGTGVTAQSVENYLEEMALDTYDLIIIITSEQFSSNHVKLAKAVQGMGRRFYVVWTKVDRDLSTSALSEPELLQTIRKSIQENLQKEGLKDIPIFLVSSFSPCFYDFPNLRETLKRDLSNIRYTDPLESLSEICDQSISDKALSLKDGGLTRHLEIAVSSMSDTVSPQESLEIYQKSFGVDDGSLWQVAQRTRSSEMGYRAMQIQDLRKMDWKLRFMMCSWVNNVLKCLSWPWWFGLWDLVIHTFRLWRQRLIIDKVAQHTKTYLRSILKDNTLPSEVHWGGSGFPPNGIQAASGSSFS